jgi:hypothetical protein
VGRSSSITAMRAVGVMKALGSGGWLDYPGALLGTV